MSPLVTKMQCFSKPENPEDQTEGEDKRRSSAIIKLKSSLDEGPPLMVTAGVLDGEFVLSSINVCCRTC